MLAFATTLAVVMVLTLAIGLAALTSPTKELSAQGNATTDGNQTSGGNSTGWSDQAANDSGSVSGFART